MKKETEKIEIPFGAKDSELYKFEYTIPEGYEAEIKDGKVIVKKKESEDERIRKNLIELLLDTPAQDIISHHLELSKVLAYLEKQKEQKPAVLSDDFELALEQFLMNADSSSNTFAEDVKKYANRLREIAKKEQKPVTNDVQQECPYKDLTLVKDFFGKYKRKCKLSNKACSSKECEEWNKLQADFKRINETFENGKEVIINHPEASGLQNPISTKETELNSIAFLEQLGYTCVPPGVKQKPAEWSEEDENKKERLISIVKRALHGNKYPFLNDNGATELITWLKSLRSKPSEKK